jgi:hypothetical protein
VEGGSIAFSGGATGDGAYARSDQEGPIRSNKSVADRFDSRALGAVRAGLVGEIVFVGQVDDRVGTRGSRTQAVQIVEVAALHSGSLGGEGFCGCGGSGEPNNLVSRGEQFVNYGGANPSGCSSNKYAHGRDPFLSRR